MKPTLITLFKIAATSSALFLCITCGLLILLEECCPSWHLFLAPHWSEGTRRAADMSVLSIALSPGPITAPTHRGLRSFVARTHECETVLDTVQARRPGPSGHPNLLLKVLGPGLHRSCLDHLIPTWGLQLLRDSLLPSFVLPRVRSGQVPAWDPLAQQALRPCCPLRALHPPGAS